MVDNRAALGDFRFMLSKSAAQKLEKIVGSGHCLLREEDRICYAYDATNREYVPDAVVFPVDSSQVSRILSLAGQERFFVVPRGAGTGMTGGSLAVRGGVVLSSARFDKILCIDEENCIARVQPGVVTEKFQKAVEEKGLFYPPDPSSSAYSTMGGNVAECAGGPRAVKYGVTRDYVLGLEAVLPRGDIIHTGVSTAKGVVGYDLTRLLVGSEGTLCVITQITVRLLPLPESVRTLTAVYDAMQDAASTVAAVFKEKILPRSLEYMDQAALACAEDHLKIGLPTDAGAVLLLEVDGDAAQTMEQARRLGEVCLRNGARAVFGVDDPARAQDLWKARKAISPALFRYGPHKINEDIVVPRNRIPDMVLKIRDLARETGLVMVSFGHAGDGNIHFNIMLDKSDPRQLAKAEAAVEKVFDYTLALGGTISGEHGIGITKAPYFSKEIPKPERDLMAAIKNVFDPHGILNPGKIFPDA